MTKLPYVYWCHHLTEVGCEWRRVDWDARIVVRGLKQEPFKGFLRVKIGGKDRVFENANIDDFLGLLMRAIGAKLREDIKGPISIVPIPNSGMAVGADGPFRCVELAEKVASGYGTDATVCAAIRWDKPRPKAHQQKDYRHPDLYEPHMRLSEKPGSPVVLFDDVITSGSQMIAAARMLTKHGFAPARALVVARATKLQPDANFLSRRPGELDLDDSPFDFDSL